MVSYGLGIWAASRDMRRWEAHNAQVQTKVRLLEEANARVAAQPNHSDAEQQRWRELQAEATRLVAVTQRVQLALPVLSFGKSFTHTALLAGILPAVWVMHFAYVRARSQKFGRLAGAVRSGVRAVGG